LIVRLRAVLFVVVAGLGSLLVGAGAGGAAAPSGGQVQIFVVPGKVQGSGTIVVAGAIGDYGKTMQQKNDIARVVLQKGTFEVTLGAISEKIDHAKPTIANTTTCTFVFGATAPAKLFNGTGTYKGISGTVMLTEKFASYGPFHKTGAQKGKCNTAMNATPIAVWGSVTGSGRVTFG
jgi:hypothetical protein